MRAILVMLLLLGPAHGYWSKYLDQDSSLQLGGSLRRQRRNAEENDISPSGTGTEEEGTGHHQNGNSQGKGESHGNASHGNHTGHKGHHGIQVASWHFEYVQTYLIVCIFLIIVCILKLGFHKTHYLSNYIPESCMLILYGIIVGAILYACDMSPGFSKLEPDEFFLIILPPIILESAYSLHDRTFIENMGTIVLYAVLGTLASCFIIGPLLYAFSKGDLYGGLQLSPTECFVFAALIVAVDPVAVLAIFQEVGVEDRLYFLVFGESLLNDAVTVVLYNMMVAFYFMEDIPGSQIGMGFASFFTVSLGGLFIGACFGIFTAFLTKYTRQVKVIEPLAVLILAYTAYLCAELFHFSGIISIIACGFLQAHFAFHNIGYKSEVTVKYFIKMLSGTMDSIIFLMLGMAMVSAEHVWNIQFIAWAIFLCIVVRFLVIFGMTFVMNRTFRFKKINLEEQFIMSYGGLRGAVCFSLVNLMDSATFDKRNLFETTTMMVIMFTVFVQGISIKPLVKLLRVTKAEDPDQNMSIFRTMHMHVNDHLLAAMEVIIGSGGTNAARERVAYYDNTYCKHWLQRDPQTKDQLLLDAYHDLEMSLRYQALRTAAQGEPIGARDVSSIPTIVQPGGHGAALTDMVLDAERRRSSVHQAAAALAEAMPPSKWDKIRGHFRKKHPTTKEDVDNIDKLMTPAKRMHQAYDPDITSSKDNDEWLRFLERQQQKERIRSSLSHSFDGNDDPDAHHQPRQSQAEAEPLLRTAHGHLAPPQSKEEIELAQPEHNNNLDRDEGNISTLPV